MIKSLASSIVVLATTSFSFSVHADFLGIYAGVSVWDTSFTGDAQVDGDLLGTQVDIVDDLGIEDEKSNIYYVAFEHPVPVLPNVRIQHTDLSVTGSDVVTEEFVFNDVTYSVGEDVSTKADLTHTDGTLYWELWDLIAEVDLGLTVRLYDGEIAIESDSVSESTSEEFTAPIPMLYGKLGVKLPFTGLSASVAANAIDYSDSKLFDATAKITYEATFGLGVEVGYRIMELDVEEDDIQANIETDGVFAGVSYHF